MFHLVFQKIKFNKGNQPFVLTSTISICHSVSSLTNTVKGSSCVEANGIQRTIIVVVTALINVCNYIPIILLTAANCTE